MIADYRHEITALLGNVTATTQAVTSLPDGSAPHYLRALTQLNPDTAAAVPSRLRWNRANAYTHPEGYNALATHLPVFTTANCSSGGAAILNPADATNPNLPNRQVGNAPDNTDFFDRYQKYAFAGELSSDDVPQAPCTKQGQFESVGEAPHEETDFQHVRPQK